MAIEACSILMDFDSTLLLKIFKKESPSLGLCADVGLDLPIQAIGQVRHYRFLTKYLLFLNDETIEVFCQENKSHSSSQLLLRTYVAPSIR